VIRIAFSRYAAVVATASSHVEALAEVSRSRPSIIVADANLSGGRSLHHFRQLTESAVEVPILLLVGSYEGIDEQGFKASGFRWFLRKPFEAVDIVAKVAEILGREFRVEGHSSELRRTPLPQSMSPGAGSITWIPSDDGGASGLGDEVPKTKARPVASSAPAWIPPPPGVGEDSVPKPESLWAQETIQSAETPRPLAGAPLGFDGQDLHTSFSLDGEDTVEAPVLDFDEGRRGRKAFDEPSKTQDQGSAPGVDKKEARSNPPAAEGAGEHEGPLDPKLRQELKVLVRQAVEEYCSQHFGTLAREVLLAEIRRLTEEKARHLTD